MKSYEELLLQNKAWAAEQISRDPGYFSRLVEVQKPEFLWIGCSDSRVPANEITNTEPGQIFVHRNIANLVVKDDVNLMSVLHYAVLVLQVRHVIVCGHYGCGGVKASLTTVGAEVLDGWLDNIRKVKQQYHQELSQIKFPNKRLDRLTELTVQEQVNNLAETAIIRQAWKEQRQPVLHGWVYRLSDGILKPVTRVEPEAET